MIRKGRVIVIYFILSLLGKVMEDFCELGGCYNRWLDISYLKAFYLGGRFDICVDEVVMWIVGVRN